MENTPIINKLFENNNKEDGNSSREQYYKKLLQTIRYYETNDYIFGAPNYYKFDNDMTWNANKIYSLSTILK